MSGKIFNVLKWVLIPVLMAVIAYAVCLVIDARDAEDIPVAVPVAIGAFLVGVVIVLVILLVLYLRSKSQAGKLEAGIGSGPGAGMSQRGEVEALRKTWRESLSTLKASGVGGGGARALQALPWFVIIGAPASGKSTLLRQSGIDFPVGDAALRGLQGTRNCDWWFSNIGVFLDTAGRYISDESAQEWARFLDLVRRHRHGAPINGCIVALPASDLIQRTPEQVEVDARRIRARLDELIDHLGISFPVWVVLTKVDLVGGFAEFFSGCDATTRAQIMGWTADLAEGGSFDRTRFRARFDAMIHRLREIRPQLLASTKLLDRPMAFAFPDQLEALGEPLSRMMHRIFERNVYHETPFFRGLYVTSATQEGTPLQKAAARIRQLLGASAAAPDPSQGLIKHCYFVKDLMHERIVQDRHMTWTTTREIERGKLKRLGMNLTGASFGVLLTLVFLGMGLRARNDLDEKGKSLAGAKSAESGVERCEALFEAQGGKKQSNLGRMGMSHQLTLQKRIAEKRTEAFQEDVLKPLVAGFATDLEKTDTTLSEHARTYEQYRVVREALERTAAGQDAPSKYEDEPKKDDGGEDGGGTKEEEAPKYPLAETLPMGPPEGFYGKHLRATLVDRKVRLRNDQVIQPKGGAPSVERLLAVLWRNREWIKGLDDLYARIEAAFLARVQDFMGKAGTAVSAFRSDRTKGREFVDSWRSGFVASCTTWYPFLTSQDVTGGQLLDALEELLDSASFKQKDGATPKEGENAALAAEREFLGSIPLVLADLEQRNLVEHEKLAAMQGWNEVGEFDPKKFGADTPDSAQAAAAAAALNALREQLQALSDVVPNLEPKIWKIRKDTFADVLAEIEAQNKEFAAPWIGKLQPQVEALAAQLPEGTGKEWQQTVLQLPGALHRAALLRVFFETDQIGTYAHLSRRLLEQRDSPESFTRTALREDLRKLVDVVRSVLDETHVVPDPKPVRERAQTLCDATFAALCTKAQSYWDDRFARLPRFGNNGWDHLKEWTGDGRTLKVLDAVAKEFGERWPLDGSLKTGAAGTFASRAWVHAENLRARYATIAEARTEITNSVGKLLSYQNPVFEDKEAIRNLSTDLGGNNSDPAWRIADSVWDSAGEITGLGTALDDLKRAVAAAENALLGKIERHYDDVWQSMVPDLADALKSGSPDRLGKAGDKVKALRKDLQDMFGPSLLYRIRGRLRVDPGFVSVASRFDSDREKREHVESGLNLAFTCEHVPVVPGKPFLRLLYEEKGREPQVFVWDSIDASPDKRRPVDLRFRPGEGQLFLIELVASRKADLKERGTEIWSKKTPDCVLALIREGGRGRTDDRLGYSRSGVAGDALFDWGSTDAAYLSQLLDPSSATSASSDLPGSCVVLEKEKP